MSEQIQKTPTQSQVETITVKIADLKQHPRQRANFSRQPDARIKELADDLVHRGQQYPIEILPDLTVLCGHQRIRAAIHLGWTEIKAIVRHDLAGKDDATIEEHMIQDNLQRRQLGPLEVAHCYRRLQELARQNRDRRTDDEIREYQRRDSATTSGSATACRDGTWIAT